MLVSRIQMKAFALNMIDFRMLHHHNKFWSINVLNVRNEIYFIESFPEWVR